MFTENPIQIKALTKTFQDFFQDSEIEYSVEEISGKKIYKINDPYEGHWALIQKEKALLWVYGAIDEQILWKGVYGDPELFHTDRPVPLDIDYEDQFRGCEYLYMEKK